MVVVANNTFSHFALNFEKNKNMLATSILIRHDNSYPFQERTLTLDQPVKIGRSVARARAANDNAIFDCKVLSRNHALLWYDSGKFFLKDTKSSNGTFINNKRLSPSGEESLAWEISSGDVVQFGVDVVESTKKVTHGCIVATLKLYLPDGKEAKAKFINSVTYVNVALEDLFKLNKFILEAGHKENALRSKLEYMQKLLDHTRSATSQSWKALVMEDSLLSRLEMLESQIAAFSKTFGTDRLRHILINLIEEKNKYENATKVMLQKKIQERKEIVNETHILKYELVKFHEEIQCLNNSIKNYQNELQEFALKYVKLQQTFHETTQNLNNSKEKFEILSKSDKKDLTRKFIDQKIETNFKISLQKSKLRSDPFQKTISGMKNYLKTLQEKNFKYSKFKKYKKQVYFLDIIFPKYGSVQIEPPNNGDKSNKISILNILDIYDIIYAQFLPCKKYFKNCSLSDLTLFQNYYFSVLSPKNTLYNYKKNQFTISKKKVLTNCKDYLNLFNKKFNFQNLSNILVLNNVVKSSKNMELLKLSMRFCPDKIRQNINKCKFLSSGNKSEDIFNYNFSSEVQKRIQSESNLHNEFNKKSHKRGTENYKSKMDTNYFSDFVKTLINKNTNTYISLQRLATKPDKTSEFIKDSIDYKNLHDQLYFLKQWLFYESHDIVQNTYNKYYRQWKTELYQAQELSECLVAIKEKYHAIHQEKTELLKKYLNLKNQSQNKLDTSNNICFYYIMPILIFLVWIYLEKMWL